MEIIFNEKSMGARLIRAQKEMDREIYGFLKREADSGENCGGCFRQCFCVSEAEFALIIDYMTKNLSKEEIALVISKANSQWELLKTSCSEIADMLEGIITLEELLNMDKISLPFSCVFYDKADKSCKVFEARPLFCRAYRGGIFSEFAEDRTCGRTSNNAKNYYLKELYKKRLAFLFLKDPEGGCIIIRRPAPLFYYFSLIFNEEIPDKIPEIEFCSDLMNLDEEDYIKKLIDRFGGCP